MELVKQFDKEFVMQTYQRNPLVIDSGFGAKVYSSEQKEYIDFTSGIGVNSLGYGHQKWLQAITHQAGKLGHISNLFYAEPYVNLAEKLVQRAQMKQIFFANSGAEANEGMIKLARKWLGESRSTILTLTGSFHGRTITTLAACGQEKFHKQFHPLTKGFSYVPAGSISELKKVLTPEVGAVMIELVQGEGGVNPLSKEYVQGLQTICREADCLLLVDEVQTGIGRCGTFFAYEHYGIQPDCVSFAKGISGGLPLGGFLASEKLVDTLRVGDHGSTFGGNPVACAAALAVLERLDEETLESIREKGDWIQEKIRSWEHSLVREVRGLGLMIGIQLSGVASSEVVQRCLVNGLLVLSAGEHVIRLLPPLIFPQAEMEDGVALLKHALDDCEELRKGE